MNDNQHQVAITTALINQIKDMLTFDHQNVRSYSVEDHPGIFRSESIRIDISEDVTLNISVWRKK